MLRRIFTTSISLLIIAFAVIAQDNPLSIKLEKHVTILASDSLEGRGFGLSTKHLASEYIINEFKNSGIKPLLDDDYIQRYIYSAGGIRIDGKNILGWIEGSDPTLKNEYILLGAHYDHLGFEMEGNEKIIYNGADDNASGVASIIEIGKMLASQKNILKRSIIIAAFDGEEIGLTGSYTFNSQLETDTLDIKIMFSLDMVGMYSSNKGVNLKGIGSLKNGTEIASQAAREEDIIIKELKGSIEMQTDTWPFAMKGIPAIHVFTGLKSPYHRPEDDSDLLDCDGMAKIGQFMVNMVKKLANENELISNNRVISHSTKSVFAIGAGLSAGYNRHHYKTDFYESKPQFAIEAGISAQWKVSRHLIVRPELTWDYYSGSTAEGAFRNHAITPQLGLLLTTRNDRSDIPFLFFMFGGYYRNNIMGSFDNTDIKYGEDYVKEEPGFKWGFGIQAMNIQVGFYRKLGQSSVIPDDSENDIVNKTTYFSVGYLF